ncbi:MAG: DUF5916 domain-containing protein [Gemmatimonadales bacterium]
MSSMSSMLARWAALAASLCALHAPTTTVTAVRIPRAPALSTRVEDPVWREVEPVSDFAQWSPREDGVPSFRTEFRVAYDAKSLYVLVRAFDPHPDSIVGILTRRDGTSASDEIGIYLDPTGDHRTGYEFYVNAAGVQRDVALSSDGYEDVTWDGVWEAVVRVDSAGWTAQLRIPFSQLQFASNPNRSFGLLVNRVIQRRSERDSWPAYHPSRPGIVSQFGVLDGLTGIGSTGGVDATPYTRVQSGGGRSPSLAAGADFRARLASNVTVDGTVLPDFGQVEADPSVVNLSSVETFYPEHRPFFLDGSGTFRMGFDCIAYLCDSDGLFYSRRIGRTPQLTSVYDDTDAFSPTPILGAAKLTSRTSDGWRLGGLTAQTARVDAPGGETIEPATTYAVARVQRDSHDGESGASLVGTFVDRSLDQWSTRYLADRALVLGGTFRHRFGGGQYEVWGTASASRLSGSPQALTGIQTNGVHFFQRPDDYRLDTTRTSLAGDQEEAAVGKYGGAFNYEIAYERQSRGYDVNDLGYLQRADQQIQENWISYNERHPASLYNSWSWNLNEWVIWNAAGMRMEAAANTNAHMILHGNWELDAGVTRAQIGSPLCDHCSRGGPALRVEPYWSPFANVTGDSRAPVVPQLTVSGSFGDEGRSRSLTESSSVSFRILPQLQASVGLVATQNEDNTQWVGNFTASAAMRYAFAHIHQHTQSFTLRASYAATTKLSFETYVAPFVSDAAYGDVRALSATPTASSYDQRYVPFTLPAGTASGFDVRQLRATSVVRWEYAPGSTLFVVWSRDAASVFTVKLSYRLGG